MCGCMWKPEDNPLSYYHLPYLETWSLSGLELTGWAVNFRDFAACLTYLLTGAGVIGTFRYVGLLYGYEGAKFRSSRFSTTHFIN